ncbi:MAG TPA: peroxiredoxin [Rhodanobacteraceae bacterium]|nr:peroxiredoxin [Rhodanobacteraceae bacterium]
MIKTGSKVPKLTGTTADGGTLKLADLQGKWLVLYFYPKDNTPGCTREAQDFRDLDAKFRRRGVKVVGVSRDSAKSHTNFAGKYDLPFPLIADSDETWCKAFDVIREKTLYGRKYMGVDRSTFLIGPDGKLVQEWRGVKVPGHAQAVLDAIPAGSK